MTGSLTDVNHANSRQRHLIPAVGHYQGAEPALKTIDTVSGLRAEQCGYPDGVSEPTPPAVVPDPDVPERPVPDDPPEPFLPDPDLPERPIDPPPAPLPPDPPEQPVNPQA